jgi:HlyD family secretion protein
VLDPSEEYAVKRNIRIGRQNTSHYEVLEGLEAGEKVIVSSYDNFNAKEKLIFRK